MKTRYFTVWTPYKICDFVTQFAINKLGGRIIKEFDKECDALSYAFALNSGDSGYYCVMVNDPNDPTIEQPIKK